MRMKIFLKSFLILFIFFICGNLYCKEYDWGSLNVRSTSKYILQWSDTPNKNLVADDTSDQDFSEILAVDAINNSRNFSFSFLGKYKKDLDGTPEGSIFQDYVDTRANRQEINFLYGYIEKDNIFGGLDVRLGRQYVYSSETVHFDGLWLRGNGIGLDWLNFEVFGGSIVQYYSQLKQDGIGGFNLNIAPFKKFSFYFDSVFYQRNSYETGIYWVPSGYIKFRSRLGLINNQKRFWSTDLTTICPKTKTIIAVNIYTHFRIRVKDDFIYDFTSVIKDDIGQDIKRLYLGREYGYTDYTISISQPIPKQEGMTVFIRFTKRKLFHDYYEDLYNTDFYRWTGGLSLEDWWKLKGTKFYIGFSYWKEQRHDYYEGVSKSVYADLEQKICDKLSLTAGIYYKNEDVNSMIEGEAAHHYYGGLRYKFGEEKWAEIKYEFETDDYYHEFGIDHINSLTLSLHYTF